jgi:dTDP-glucose pyrophosphorylase
MNDHITPFLVLAGTTVVEAMRQLEDTAQKTLFVVDDKNHLLGSLTDGDIRRWILAGSDLHGRVESVCNPNPFSVMTAYEVDDVRRTMIKNNISCVPVLTNNRQVTALLFWEDVFEEKSVSKASKSISLPVVIMAGGKGTRLDPFTKVLPKPLIPLGDKTVIEHIIDSFLEYDVSEFFLSVNEKSKIIKSYFEELAPTYSISYVEENEPLGTAGSLRCLRDRLKGSLVVTNCDIIIAADYAELVDFHSQNGDDITVVGSLKNYRIPYGVCEIVNGGTLTRINEKPEYNFLVNTGMYVLRADTLRLIPEGRIFHMTQLIDSVRDNGGKVSIFPVSDKAWIDTGEWAEYRKALRQLQVD